MKRIIVVWDENEGIAVPDGKVQSKVDWLIANVAMCHVGVESLINEFRLRHVRGQVEVYIVPEVESWRPIDQLGDYKVTKTGRLNSWSGLCHLEMDQLSQLIEK